MKLLFALDECNYDSHASELAKQFTVLDAMECVMQSWDEVKSTIISKYFENCRFRLLSDNDSEEENDSSNGEDGLEELMCCLDPKEEVLVDEELDCFDVDIVKDSVIDFVIEDYNNNSSNTNCEENTTDSVDGNTTDSVNGNDEASEEQPQLVISSSVAQRYLVEITAFLNRRGIVVEEG